VGQDHHRVQDNALYPALGEARYARASHRPAEPRAEPTAAFGRSRLVGTEDRARSGRTAAPSLRAVAAHAAPPPGLLVEVADGRVAPGFVLVGRVGVDDPDVSAELVTQDPGALQFRGVEPLVLAAALISVTLTTGAADLMRRIRRQPPPSQATLEQRLDELGRTMGASARLLEQVTAEIGARAATAARLVTAHLVLRR
jgi:hypothetical protein